MSVLVIPTSVPSLSQPAERHRTGRAAWLRAAVLGADDAIVSTASLMLGVVHLFVWQKQRSQYAHLLFFVLGCDTFLLYRLRLVSSARAA